MVRHKKPKLGKIPHYYSQITYGLVGWLIFVIFIGVGGGILKTLFELRGLLNDSVEVITRRIIVDTLIILALIEVLRTALSYLTEGRVRVTFIIDTVLIVMLNELMSFWFKGGNLNSFIILVISIFTLILARVIAIRFSPGNTED